MNNELAIAELAAEVASQWRTAGDLDFVGRLAASGLITVNRATAILQALIEARADVAGYRKPDADDLFGALPSIASTWIEAANVTRPAWTRGHVIWSEDDAGTPDRERLSEAWRRIFGRELRDEPVLGSWDGGDCFARLHPGGRSSWCVLGLGQIEVMKPCVVARGERGPARADRDHRLNGEDDDRRNPSDHAPDRTATSRGDP